MSNSSLSLLLIRKHLNQFNTFKLDWNPKQVLKIIQTKSLNIKTCIHTMFDCQNPPLQDIKWTIGSSASLNELLHSYEDPMLAVCQNISQSTFLGNLKNI